MVVSIIRIRFSPIFCINLVLSALCFIIFFDPFDNNESYTSNYPYAIPSFSLSNNIIMIQSIHKGAQEQRLRFPIPGQSGFGSPVGRKHIGSKLTAIQKLIFNQDTRPPSRRAYNQTKINPTQPLPSDDHTERSYPSTHSLQTRGNYSMAYYPSQQELRRHKYDIMQRESYLDAEDRQYMQNQGSDLYQLKSSSIEQGRPSNKRHYSPKQDRLNSLDKIINPYHCYQSLLRIQKREREHTPPSLKRTNQNTQPFPQIEQISHALDTNAYRKGFSPTFLNSLI